MRATILSTFRAPWRRTVNAGIFPSSCSSSSPSLVVLLSAPAPPEIINYVKYMDQHFYQNCNKMMVGQVDAFAPSKPPPSDISGYGPGPAQAQKQIFIPYQNFLIKENFPWKLSPEYHTVERLINKNYWVKQPAMKWFNKIETLKQWASTQSTLKSTNVLSFELKLEANLFMFCIQQWINNFLLTSKIWLRTTLNSFILVSGQSN